jgi:hypothetical protein
MAKPNVVTEPTSIDACGNISVNGRSGVYFLLQFSDGTTLNGLPVPNIPVAGADIYFEVDGILRVPLAPGPDNYSRYLQLDDAQVEALPLVNVGRGAYFVIRDETGSPGIPPRVYWEGWISARNFNVQPPAGPP